LGVNTPKNLSLYAQILRRGTSGRPYQSAFYYAYLSITNWEMTLESVFECLVSSIISADCQVSEYFHEDVAWQPY